MNPQTVIQALIRDYLITTAKMYSHEKEFDKMHMLCTCAMNFYADDEVVRKVIRELNENPNLYPDQII